MGAAIIVGVVTVSALIYGGYKLFEAHKDKEAGDAVGAQADADLKAMRETEKAKEKAIKYLELNDIDKSYNLEFDFSWGCPGELGYCVYDSYEDPALDNCLILINNFFTRVLA